LLNLGSVALSTLVDLYQWWAGDLTVTVSGDLMGVTGLTRSQQRIVRRLCTNPGSYIAQPTYGGGLGQFIGTTSDPDEIVAVVRAQMLLEDSVASVQSIIVNQSPNGLQNAISLTINYTDSPSNAPTVLAFTLA
jgi:hypothetical protein